MADLGIGEVAAIASVATAAVGTAVSVAGAEQQASANSAAAKYQAQVALNNQQLAKQQAGMEVQKGEALAAQTEQKTRATVGAITAAQAANNIDVNTGSAVDVRTGAQETGQLDALTVRSNAARAAYGYETQGTSFGADAALLEAQSQQAATAGIWGGAASLLGGASSVGSKYVQFQQEGLFGSNNPAATNLPPNPSMY